MNRPFVPADFTVPLRLATARFCLEPLGPQHNSGDLAAWSGSIGHIRATPGFREGNWPPADGMTAEQNRADLQGHADDFARRTGFTYTVIESPGDRVVGCVYIYPSRTDDRVTTVRSWVSADRSAWDAPLYAAVSAWLAADWPLGAIEYDPR